MIAIALLLVRMLCDCLKSRSRLEAELVVLRHQLNVLRLRAPRRLYLRWADRILFVWLYRRFPRTLDAITIVRPETVVLKPNIAVVSAPKRPIACQDPSAPRARVRCAREVNDRSATKLHETLVSTMARILNGKTFVFIGWKSRHFNTNAVPGPWRRPCRQRPGIRNPLV